jgi:hypothetical protein
MQNIFRQSPAEICFLWRILDEAIDHVVGHPFVVTLSHLSQTPVAGSMSCVCVCVHWCNAARAAGGALHAPIFPFLA